MHSILTWRLHFQLQTFPVAPERGIIVHKVLSWVWPQFLWMPTQCCEPVVRSAGNIQMTGHLQNPCAELKILYSRRQYLIPWALLSSSPHPSLHKVQKNPLLCILNGPAGVIVQVEGHPWFVGICLVLVFLHVTQLTAIFWANFYHLWAKISFSSEGACLQFLHGLYCGCLELEVWIFMHHILRLAQ